MGRRRAELEAVRARYSTVESDQPVKDVGRDGATHEFVGELSVLSIQARAVVDDGERSERSGEGEACPSSGACVWAGPFSQRHRQPAIPRDRTPQPPPRPSMAASSGLVKHKRRIADAAHLLVRAEKVGSLFLSGRHTDLAKRVVKEDRKIETKKPAIKQREKEKIRRGVRQAGRPRRNSRRCPGRTWKTGACRRGDRGVGTKLSKRYQETEMGGWRRVCGVKERSKVERSREIWSSEMGRRRAEANEPFKQVR